MAPRVAIFLINYDLWTSPSVINAANVLAERGYAVDIFTDTSQPVDFIRSGALPIHLYILRNTTGAPDGEQVSAIMPTADPGLRRTRRWVRRLLPRAAGDVVRDLWVTFGWKLPYVAHCIREAWPRIRANGPYTCFIGVEPFGLVAATIIGRLCGVPTIYWSLELWLWRESRTLVERTMKMLEYLCQRRAEFTIIQDEDRADHLAHDNRVPRSSFVVVPATARGPSRTERSDYLRAKLGIPDSQKILLHAGSIRPWARCVELAAAAQTWPEDWVLVLHGFGPAEYIEEVQRQCCVRGRVFFSLHVVPYDQLDPLISSADIGVAFYEGLGPNWSLMGSASSKVGQYLKCGLPVITSDSPSLQRIVSTYRCGVCVSSPAQMAAAAQEIFNNYTTYQTNALRCFEEKLDFDKYFREVVHRIDQCCMESTE